MPLRPSFITLFLALTGAAGSIHAQGTARAATPPTAAADADEPSAVADPAELAFEQGRWEDAIREYRAILADYAEDRLSLLRIAQAQRELKRYDEALATLEQARTANAPEAMIDFERARNLALLRRDDDALAALDASDHNGLRALGLVEGAKELDRFRGSSRFERVHRQVRARVYPCEGIPEASAFDFWLGRWEVRQPDGTIVGTNTITKRDGGCSIQERWEGAGGSSGTSVSFYLPSRGEWRQIWTGSGGTLFDITGKPTDTGMHLEGQIEYVDTHNVVAFRGTWTKADDGRVRQRLEEFDLTAQTWIVWFDGFYRRIE
ncbi:MAG TPA: tetratricopeptide repeat protein [Gammaproteobacteria bacterium]|nr:tetratricopeptide repeat protein [Gammaproteobacteria bacterium]